MSHLILGHETMQPIELEQLVFDLTCTPHRATPRTLSSHRRSRWRSGFRSRQWPPRSASRDVPFRLGRCWGRVPANWPWRAW